MFVESIKRVHPEITEQGASQLREFLVTAHQRQQSDNQVLSMGLQALKQEVLDEGYDWNELITMLVDLVCADMQEDQHGRFVAELERLYVSNASLMEIGFVMASDYPSTLEELNLLVQLAQEDHEALAGVAGGTGKSVFRTWKRNPNRTKREKREAIAVDAVEAAVGLTLLTGGGILAYKGIKRAMTRGGGEEVQQVERLADNAARDIVPDAIIDSREIAVKDANEVMDTKAKVNKGEAGIDDKIVEDVALLRDKGAKEAASDAIGELEPADQVFSIKGEDNGIFDALRNVDPHLAKEPKIGKLIDLDFPPFPSLTRGGGEEVQQVERLADNAARDIVPDAIIDSREIAVKDANEVMDTKAKVNKGEAGIDDKIVEDVALLRDKGAKEAASDAIGELEPADQVFSIKGDDNGIFDALRNIESDLAKDPKIGKLIDLDFPPFPSLDSYDFQAIPANVPSEIAKRSPVDNYDPHLYEEIRFPSLNNISNDRRYLTDSDFPKQFFIDKRPPFKTAGFKEIAIKEDGNCFYRSIANFMGDEEGLKDYLRMSSVDYLRANPKQFEPFVQGIEPGNVERKVYGVDEFRDVEHYCSLQEIPGVHADAPTIKGLSKSNNINIGIKTGNRDRIQYFLADDPVNAETVYLHHVNGNHYNLFRELEEHSEGVRSFKTGDLYHEINDDVTLQWPGLSDQNRPQAIRMKESGMSLDDIYRVFDVNSNNLSNAKKIQGFLEDYRLGGMSSKIPVIDNNIDPRKDERAAMKAVNNDGFRIQLPDDKKGGRSDAGRLYNGGEIDSLPEAPRQAAERIETGVDGEIEELVPQVEDKALSEIGAAVKKDLVTSEDAVEDTAEGVEREML